MLTSTDFRILREKCPVDLETYLKRLNIPCPDWAGGDEFKISAELDDKITTNLSRLLKSESVIAGYMALLKAGHVSFSYSESDNDLLEKILSNKDAIMHGATQPAMPQPQVEKPAATPQPDAARRPVSGKAALQPILFGGLLLVVGVLALFGNDEPTGAQKVGGITAFLLGFGAVFWGFKRRTAARNSIPIVPQRAPRTPETPPACSPAFTVEEMQHVFDMLSATKKIVTAL